MSLPEVVILLLQLTDIIVEAIDFLYHSHFIITLDVKILLKFSVLFVQAIIQDLYLIFVVSLYLLDLNSP